MAMKAMKTKGTKTVIYTRTSTKTNQKGDSVDRQVRAAKMCLGPSKAKNAKVISDFISGMLPLSHRKRLLSLFDGSYCPRTGKKLQKKTKGSGQKLINS